MAWLMDGFGIQRNGQRKNGFVQVCSEKKLKKHVALDVCFHSWLFVVDSVQLGTDHTKFKNWYGWRQVGMQEHVDDEENVYINNFSECPVPMKNSIILSSVFFRWELERIIRAHFANTLWKENWIKGKNWFKLCELNLKWVFLVVWHLEIVDISFSFFPVFYKNWRLWSYFFGVGCIFS